MGYLLLACSLFLIGFLFLIDFFLSFKAVSDSNDFDSKDSNKKNDVKTSSIFMALLLFSGFTSILYFWLQISVENLN